MQVVLNLRLPKDLTKEINVYRKKYDARGFSHQPAHITLVPPFILRGELSELVSEISDSLANTSRFQMEVDGLGSFGDRVIFVRPNCPEELRKLQALLKKLVREKYRRGGHERYWNFRKYVPHITIAKTTPEKIKKYKQELKDFEYKRSFTVEGVDLYVQGRGRRWMLKKTFLFGK